LNKEASAAQARSGGQQLRKAQHETNSEKYMSTLAYLMEMLGRQKQLNRHRETSFSTQCLDCGDAAAAKPKRPQPCSTA
jgi:hypothetical protein